MGDADGLKDGDAGEGENPIFELRCVNGNLIPEEGVMASEELTIAEALENLTTLVDAESLEELEVTESARLVSHKREREEGEHEITWVQAGSDDLTLAAIKQTFRVVHDYLEHCYHRMKKKGDIKRLIEGVNTVMVLVGEAAKKLERYSSLFKERVTEVKEYKDLHDFYRNKLVKESFQLFAKAPIALKREKEEEGVLPAAEEEVEEVAGIHILNDLDVVKRDHLYELFYLKNEVGHHFYTFELARNIKLACDFGQFSDKYFGQDPLLQIANWKDKSLHILAKRMLRSVKQIVSKFYKEALRYKDMDFIISLHNAVMALMLAANPRNLIRQFAGKACYSYFTDFQLFFREVLQNREYQKFLFYAPPLSKPFFMDMVEFAQALSLAFFLEGRGQEELKNGLKQLCGINKTKTISAFLSEDFRNLSEALTQHPNGPVFKTLDLIIEEEESRRFDPFMQDNIPGPLGSLVLDSKEIILLHLPSPVHQEWIDRAEINDEFVTFLRAWKREHKENFLLINFQDRTSWLEHARCVAVEELAHQAEFADFFNVVTMSKDTPFYNQTGAYHEITNAEDFISHFSSHLGDESSGFYFPALLKSALFPSFVDELLPKIHEVFFDKKKILTMREKLDFIELTYTFIELKCVEIVDPSLLSLSSKDSLDIGGTATVGLFALLNMANGVRWSEAELDHLRFILFGPTLICRERAIHPERFDRLCHMLKMLEEHPDFAKSFQKLFKKKLLQFRPSFKKVKDEL